MCTEDVKTLHSNTVQCGKPTFTYVGENLLCVYEVQLAHVFHKPLPCPHERNYLFICLLVCVQEKQEERELALGRSKVALDLFYGSFFLNYYDHDYITILLLIIYSFCMGSKLNDLITNICCNSESCLPTNKLLTQLFGFLPLECCYRSIECQHGDKPQLIFTSNIRYLVRLLLFCQKQF